MTASFDIWAAVLFGGALAHTFMAGRIHSLAGSFPRHRRWLLVFGEVELVFALWSIPLVLSWLVVRGPASANAYWARLSFHEAIFVFVIMLLASCRPVLVFARDLIAWVARALPLGASQSTYVASLVVGPLLGSFITEPAAMVVTAALLRESYFGAGTSLRFKYVTLALLFVNVSIGGVLTPYAAPPVLMVASRWEWDLSFMLAHFGWKAALAVGLNTLAGAWIFRREFSSVVPSPRVRETPAWLNGLHLAILGLAVYGAHDYRLLAAALGAFALLFVITRQNQSPVKFKEAALVALFLGGLVVLGSVQQWWMAPLLEKLQNITLFLGATVLTAFTDNAALTYFGAQVQNASNSFKYYLVAGGVAGGGLTVIANAPNPIGYSLLLPHFGAEGIRPLRLLAAALIPTLVVLAVFWFL
ncbi:MAG: hypothetical protein JST16_18340 [Bdellovibrionales bacterium]|nr:hypothetical protein [Bdellovibrionales bacterium]